MISRSPLSMKVSPLCVAASLLAAMFLAGCTSWPPDSDTRPDAVVTVEIDSEPAGAEIWSIAKMHDGDIGWKDSVKVGVTPFKGLAAFYVHPKGRGMAVRGPGECARLFHFKSDDRRWFVAANTVVLSMDFTLKKRKYRKKTVKEVVCEDKVNKAIGIGDAKDAVEAMREALVEQKALKFSYKLKK